MVDKTKYLEKFKAVHNKKTGIDLSDADALDMFENLVVLVGAITSHVAPKDVIIPRYGKESQAK